MGMHSKLLIIFFLFCQLDFQIVNATISQNFQNYIRQKYGEETVKQLARTDFGSTGSFGGGNHKAGKTTKKTPVVFVHGVSSSARSTEPIARAFKQYGYDEAELYGTTYGIAMGMMPMQTALNCEYIKGVRSLIKAVAGFTNQKVDVIGYSLGGPVSRKAILGGKCVETGEDLGPPLTKTVNAYLGVAGAQQGCRMCTWMFSGMCNLNNGIGCNSKFYQDINSKSGYEGQKIYVLQSFSDEIVGHTACGKKASEIQGSSQTVTLNGYLHLQMCSAITAQTQFNLLTKGTQN